jgi:three-Cys-motif partner protein
MAKLGKPDAQQEFFGGPWTQEKLARVQKYLSAYIAIFTKNQAARHFRTTYVDAFAGTGYMAEPEALHTTRGSFFPELAELAPNAGEYAKGSAVRALELDPGFDTYLFIEADVERAKELNQLKSEFQDKADRIEVVNADANAYLGKWCGQTDWKKNRAVVFLDPFGMQVEWQLIDKIANTQAIDLWLLFPLFAINRLLVRYGKPPAGWGKRLTVTLGTDEWEKEFYNTQKSTLIEGLEFAVLNENLTKCAFYAAF